MTAARVALVVVGAAVSAYGAWLLLGEGDVPEVATWFVAGVLLHDFVLVPLVLLVGVALVRFAPPVVRAPLAVGLLVLGSVTLAVVPVLGGFGRSPGNPTLLDRDYTLGWVVLAAAVAVGVAAAALVRRRRRRVGGTDAA
ncbi:hypothetical protein [Nocardioides sp. GXQ0305]|uniref:hypothetical protein n=1 Tax=Nocardioides sp. GXQ0305 TaxID=3423912 RepID=UPI003D7E0FFC